METMSSKQYTPQQLRELPSLLPFHFPGISNVECWFSTALYGNISLDFDLAGDADKERRAELAAILGFECWTEMKQVHGDDLLLDPPSTLFGSPSELEADGCCTSVPGQAMLAKSADCQQIILAHTSGKYVAALHCGWKGNSIDFPTSAVQNFCEAYELNPKDVMAVRGPSLGPNAAEFINFAEEWPERFEDWFNLETKCMDLWSLTRHQLMQGGLLHSNIFSIDLCTYSLSSLLYSYRRGHSGRQAALVFIKK